MQTTIGHNTVFIWRENKRIIIIIIIFYKFTTLSITYVIRPDKLLFGVPAEVVALLFATEKENETDKESFFEI